MTGTVNETLGAGVAATSAPKMKRAGDRMGKKSDPTDLTTKQLHREISTLRELFEMEAKWEEKLRTERLGSVQERFVLIEMARIEQKADTKAAVDAALTAQKEAVKEQTTASERAIAKSENATSKQLEALDSTFSAALKGVIDLLNDTKDRVSKVESMKQGAEVFVNNKRGDATVILMAASAIISVVAVVLAAFHI